jgi:spore germination cell wall hydrolase CwlJ-like protein
LAQKGFSRTAREKKNMLQCSIRLRISHTVAINPAQRISRPNVYGRDTTPGPAEFGVHAVTEWGAHWALVAQDTEVLTIKFQACADARALAGGLVLGTAIGFALGGAYLAGGMAQAASAHAKVVRLSAAAAHGFSEDALRAQASGMAAGALAIARRHDPYVDSTDPRAERVASLVSNRLNAVTQASQARTGGEGLLLRASYGGPANPAAQPFRAASVLESTRDLDCLAEAVYYEARGESASGQAAVAQVVLNRVRHPAFPKSVCAVVFQGAGNQGCQFSFACDGSMRKGREPEAWRQARSVAARALAGFVMPSVGNATHFHVAGLSPQWGPQMTRVAQIGLHVFYRFGGRVGAPGSFTAQPHPSAPGSDGHPVYASMLPVGGGADGGGLTLASAVVSPSPTPTGAPAAKPAADAVAPAAKTEPTHPADAGGAKGPS